MEKENCEPAAKRPCQKRQGDGMAYIVIREEKLVNELDHNVPSLVPYDYSSEEEEKEQPKNQLKQYCESGSRDMILEPLKSGLGSKESNKGPPSEDKTETPLCPSDSLDDLSNSESRFENTYNDIFQRLKCGHKYTLTVIPELKSVGVSKESSKEPLSADETDLSLTPHDSFDDLSDQELMIYESDPEFVFCESDPELSPRLNCSCKCSKLESSEEHLIAIKGGSGIDFDKISDSEYINILKDNGCSESCFRYRSDRYPGFFYAWLTTKQLKKLEGDERIVCLGPNEVLYEC